MITSIVKYGGLIDMADLEGKAIGVVEDGCVGEAVTSGERGRHG